MATDELQIKISLARAGLANDAAAASRIIKGALDETNIPIGVDRKKLEAEIKAVDAFLAGKFDEIPVGFKVDKDGKLRNELGQFVEVTRRQVQQGLKGIDVDLTIDDKSVRLAKQAIDQLGNETLQTAKQAEFLRNAYNLNDDEINQVIRKMGQLERSTKDAKTQGGALQEVFTGFLRRVGESAFQALIGAVQRLGQVVANTVRTAVAGFIEFERAIKQAGVVSGSIGTAEFEALNEEIERLGIVTSKTPVEIASTAVALSRAGFRAEETTAAMEGIARASEASGESLEVVGDIIAKTTRAFGLAAQDSQFLANALVSTANNTNTTVAGLGESFNYIGATARAANQPVDDILVLLGLLGDAGIQGSAAGTNLAAALERLKIASAGGETEFSNLVRGSKRASEAFDIIGAEVRNADGSMKSMLEILPVIQQNLSTLGQADKDVLMKALFGVEGGRAFQTLLNATPERVAQVTEQIKVLGQEGEGAAVRAGEQMLSGLSGALDLIGGSIGSLGNEFGKSLGPALEAVVRGATDIINTLLEMDGLFDPLTEASQRFAVALGGSQEVAGSLTDQVVNFAEVAIEQLASVIDALTAFVAEEGNITQLSEGFESLVTVLKALAGVTNFVIALGDGFFQLKTKAESLPLIGDNIERLLKFPTGMTLLTESMTLLGEVFVSLKNFVINAIDNILERMERILPVLKPIIDRVQGILGRLGGGTPESTPTPTGDIIPAPQPEEDNRNPNRPRVPTRTGTATNATDETGAVAAAQSSAQAEFKVLDDLENKYRELTTTLETEQANQVRALVEAGNSREEIAAKEAEYFQKRIDLNEEKLAELKAIDQGTLSTEDAAKVAQAILDLDQQLASDRLKLAQDTRRGQEDAIKELEKAQEDAAKEEEKRRQDAIKAVEAQMAAEENLASVALEAASVRLSALDRVAEGLEQQSRALNAQAQLAESIGNLEAAIADEKAAALQAILDDEEASDSQKRKAARDLLNLTKQQFETEKAQLEAKQALELQQFDLRQQQGALAEQRAIREQELALKRLDLQRLEIQNEIELARLRGDTNAIAIGEAQLGLLQEQTAAEREYLGALQQQAAISQQLGASERAGLLAAQEQADIALASEQRGQARAIDDQISGIDSRLDRGGDRLFSQSDRALQRELRQARNALPGLEGAGINPQALALAGQPTLPAGGLAGANFAQPIVAELQTLNGAINALAASPRQLTVQTPDPVADTSRILSDISRQQTAGVNP